MLERIFDRVDDVLKPIQFGNVIKTVTLSEKPDAQWESIHENLIFVQKTFREHKEKLKSSIRTTVAEFKNVALSEIVNKLGAIGEMLDGSGIKGDRLYTVSESISTMTASIEKINSRIDTDLKEIENDFNDIVDQCMNQGKRMYLDLRMIAASSKAHLLKPMFDISKHFNVQLICLSDINKSDVVGCFDCVIKLVIKTQSLSNFEIMMHEGNERIEHGYYKIMNGQMSLF